MITRLDQLNGSKFEEIGELGVDSGQIMLTDPCYVLDYNQFGDETDKSYDDVLNAYNGDHNQPYITPWRPFEGLVVGTLYGDGAYKVYARMVDGRCAQVLIDFEQLDE